MSKRISRLTGPTGAARLLRGLVLALTATAAMQLSAAALNINVGTIGSVPSLPFIDGDGSCTLDGGQNNGQICTNDIARYRVQYQAIGPAPSTNLTITSGPLPADFRWSKNGPGMGACHSNIGGRKDPNLRRSGLRSRLGHVGFRRNDRCDRAKRQRPAADHF